jgi:hypothetical protein
MNQPVKTHWPSVLLFVLSSVSSMLFLSIGALMSLSGLMEYASDRAVIAQSTLMYAAASIFAGIVLWPAIYYSFMKILNRTARELSLQRIPTSTLVIVWILSAGATLLYGKFPSISILLIPINLFTFVLPVWILVRIGLRGIQIGSPERRWGTIAVGFTIVPFLISFLEIMVISLIILLFIIGISTNPTLMNQIQSLATRLLYTKNPEALIRILSPYILNPVIIFTGLAFLSVCVPLIEEIIKPLGVWLMPNKMGSPQQGFAIGLLGGAAYALFESLGVFPGGIGSMNVLSVARIGTDLLHVTTAGLMGWALVRSWQDRKYVQLSLTYLTVVLLHGLWNALSLASAVGFAIPYVSNPSPLLKNLPTVSIIGLILMSLINLAILLRANHLVGLQGESVSDLSSDGLYQS